VEQGKQQEMKWTPAERWAYTKPLIRSNPGWVIGELLQLHKLKLMYERKLKYRPWVRCVRYQLIKWWRKYGDGA
jgi:hypothetical protein